MKDYWNEIVIILSKLPPIVQCVLIVVLASIMILVMVDPIAGTSLTSFLMALSIVVDRFRHQG